MAARKIEIPDTLRTLERRFLTAYECGVGLRGVKCPTGKRRLVLMRLFEVMPEPLTHDEIASWFHDHGLPHYDRQIRHLARAGWHLETGCSRATDFPYNPEMARSQVRLVSIDMPNPIAFPANRSGIVSKLDWEAKVEQFERVRGGCAVCGEKQRTYDKGHLDRSRGMEIDNLVPMCAGCNNHAQAYDFDFKLSPKSLKARPVPRIASSLAA